jgi:hypothetical protein
MLGHDAELLSRNLEILNQDLNNNYLGDTDEEEVEVFYRDSAIINTKENPVAYGGRVAELPIMSVRTTRLANQYHVSVCTNRGSTF